MNACQTHGQIDRKRQRGRERGREGEREREGGREGEGEGGKSLPQVAGERVALVLIQDCHEQVRGFPGCGLDRSRSQLVRRPCRNGVVIPARDLHQILCQQAGARGMHLEPDLGGKSNKGERQTFAEFTLIQERERESGDLLLLAEISQGFYVAVEPRGARFFYPHGVIMP